MISWQENRSFPLAAGPASLSPFAYGRPGRPPGQIDWPQRFGPTAFWSFAPGATFARMDVVGVGVGVSTENLWWGPGRENSVLMTTTAAGFPHLFLKTSHPVSIGVGHLEAEAVWGRLGESDYFNANPDDDHRLLSALIVTFSPRGAPGLHLGAGRVFHRIIPPDGGLGFSDFVPFFQSSFKIDLITPENPSGQDKADQIASLFFRWSLPESGFEVYGEWAQNDHHLNVEDLVSEPDHARGYVLGLQKVFRRSGGWSRLHAEVTNLGITPSFIHRSSGSFYTNGTSRQGYTNEGQLLGASVGPGGDAQSIGFDWFVTRGWLGAFLERRRHDGDAYYRSIKIVPISQGGTLSYHDAEFGGGIRGHWLAGRIGVEWEAAYAHRYHRYFVPTEMDENVRLSVGLEWLP